MADRLETLHAEFLAAVGRGDVARVRVYLNDPDVDVNYAEPRQGFTALHIAAARNAVAVIRLLIATGKCDVGLKDHEGRTAARLAVILADNPAVGRYLLDRQYGTPPERGAEGGAGRQGRARRERG